MWVSRTIAWLRRHWLTLFTVVALGFAVYLSQQNRALRNHLAPQGMLSLSRSGDIDKAQSIVASWTKSLQGQEQNPCCDRLARARRFVTADNFFIPFYVIAIAGLCWRTARKLDAASTGANDAAWRARALPAGQDFGAKVARVWQCLKHRLWRVLVPLGYLSVLASLAAGWIDFRENAMLRTALELRWDSFDARSLKWDEFLLKRVVGAALIYLLLASATLYPWRRWLSVVWHVGKRCVYIVIFIAAAIVLFVLLDQGQDYLRLVTQPERRGWWQVSFCGGALVWAFASFYYARLALQQPERRRPIDPIPDPVRKWTPRVLGTLPLAILAIAFLQLSNWRWALGFALASVLMGLFVVWRRSMFPRLVPGDAARTSEASIFRPLVAGVLLAVVAVIGICYSGVSLPQQIGAAGLVFLSAVVWIIAGTTLFILIPLRNGNPTLASLPLFLFAASSFFNDNHEIRTTKLELQQRGDDTTLSCERQQRDDQRCKRALDKYFEDWFSANHPNANEAVPVYIVIAEGGGVRAAYWTATVLARLQDQMKNEKHDFAKHVFAISGISGGSLGAVVFDSLLKHAADHPDFDCPDTSAEQVGRFERCARQILRADFISPALAGLLVTDALQRFIPLAFPSLDRAVNLERAWEQGWECAMQARGDSSRCRESPNSKTGLAASFTSLWRGGHCALSGGWCYDMPLLFLNGAVVQTGQRIVTAPLEAPRNGNAPLHDAVDAFARSAGPIEMRLSTAAHMSARFPVISPAGWFAVRGENASAQERTKTDDSDQRYLHVVDGGAFEPLGSSTAFDLIDAVTQSDLYKTTPSKINLRVLVITNSPPSDRDGSHKASRLLSEVFDQPLALLNSRGGHADYFVERMKAGATQPARTGAAQVQAKPDAVPESRLLFARIGMYPDHIDKMPESCTQCSPPLGWSLSSCTADEMDRTLDAPRVRGEVSRALTGID